MTNINNISSAFLNFSEKQTNNEQIIKDLIKFLSCDVFSQPDNIVYKLQYKKLIKHIILFCINR